MLYNEEWDKKPLPVPSVPEIFAKALISTEWLEAEAKRLHQISLLREREAKQAPADGLWRVKLIEAADLIDRRGWVQNTSESHRGICVGHALNTVTNNPILRQMCIDRMNQYLAAHGKGDGMQFPVGWNDMPGRTKAEVVDALRACALAA